MEQAPAESIASREAALNKELQAWIAGEQSPRVRDNEFIKNYITRIL